ncbi:preprotein translocase subunit SecD, partial [Modestobacter sp. VKM Ac-2676]
MAARQLAARRYFAAFLLIVAGLYALVFLTGDQRTPQLGLDLQGGTTVTLTAQTPDGEAPAREDLELARRIIEQRVNGLGVAEAEVVTEGDSNIVISVPGDDGEAPRT